MTDHVRIRLVPRFQSRCRREGCTWVSLHQPSWTYAMQDLWDHLDWHEEQDYFESLRSAPGGSTL